MNKILILCVIVFGISSANANETKTITPQEFGNAVVEMPGKVVVFLTNEVEKTKEYQAESWANAKMQTAQNWAQLKSLFVVKYSDGFSSNFCQ